MENYKAERECVGHSWFVFGFWDFGCNSLFGCLGVWVFGTGAGARFSWLLCQRFAALHCIHSTFTFRLPNGHLGILWAILADCALNLC